MPTLSPDGKLQKMRQLILLLAACLLSCSQHPVPEKIKDKPLIDSAVLKKEDKQGDTMAFYAGRKAGLDSLFLQYSDSAAFTSQSWGTSLLIGCLFDKAHKDAVLRYEDNDSVANVIVLRQSDKNWDTIFSTKVYPVSTGMLEDLIVVSDFNGDNIPDLKIIKEHWDIHPGERADLWLYGKGHFRQVQSFDKIVSAEYDKRTNLIYSYHSTGCADMAMYFGVFKITGTCVKTVKEMSCDCCAVSGDSCSIAVVGEKPYLVPYNRAYKHVPVYYAAAVKEKCEL